MYSPTLIPYSVELVNARLREMIARQVGQSVTSLPEDGDLIHDFGLDSLGMLELLLSCEDEFQLVIPESEWIRITEFKQLTMAISDYVHIQRRRL